LTNLIKWRFHAGDVSNVKLMSNPERTRQISGKLKPDLSLSLNWFIRNGINRINSRFKMAFEGVKTQWNNTATVEVPIEDIWQDSRNTNLNQL